MKQSTALLVSAALSIAAAIAAATAAFALGVELGVWRWLLVAGAALSAVAAFYSLREATWRRRAWLLRLFGRRDGDGGRDEDLPALPSEFAALLEERVADVERRERELADRLAGYHQWLEFPPPVDLSEVQPPSLEVLQRDRKLEQLLEEKTRDLFEKIRTNEYSPGGTFQFKLVREDVYALVGEIAALYGDDPKRPLAGTSSERVVRAAGRCCFKFLVELDKLPLGIRDYDLVDIYRYVRQAVNVYGFYRSARPYMPWLRGAYYGTSLAMGSNPLSLGAWWFLSSLGSRTATAVATNVANRWALNFLHDIVRVIGYEVAGVYDNNLRYRDPNWCFAAELTELVQTFPSTEASLRRSLSILGGLQLQNEYDRIFFFRCIVEGKNAGLKRAHSADLPVEQRKGIAERLEGFVQSHIADPDPKAVERWRRGVEDRLDLSLALAGEIADRPEEEQREDAARCLAGYLLEIKQVELEDLAPLLGETRLVASLSEGERNRLWQSLRAEPPFFFQPPEVAPAGAVAEVFLEDLVALAAGVRPRYPVADELVLSTAARLRVDTAEIEKRLQREYVAAVGRRLPEETPTRWVPTEVARAVLDLLQDEETLRFIYGGVRAVASNSSEPVQVDRSELWLVGLNERLVAFAAGDPPQLVWEGDRDVRLEISKGRFRGVCRLVGGRWLDEPRESTPMLLVPGNLLGSRRRYFAPLEAFCQAARQPGT